MKKFFITVAFLFSLILPVNAEVMPYYVSSINTSSIGVYQASNTIVVHQEPNEKSSILLDVYWNGKIFKNSDVSASNLFIVFAQPKELAFLQVVDETEDWVQIVFNKNGEQRGWVKKDDEYRYMNWRTFFNLYGRKYGVYYMKDAPECSKNIYGSNVDDAQSIGMINYPQTIRITAVKGNWLLVNVFDMDKLQKIGWVKWRSVSGEVYLFPAIK